MKRRRRLGRRAALSVYAALALAAVVLPSAAPAQEGGWLERWLYNPEERTAAALDAAARGDRGDLVEPLEAALRLSQGSPVARYNSGTARLMNDASGALALLRSAVDETGLAADLAADASYNLGNAFLADEEYRLAIDAYKEALRHAPDFADAKFNLELARLRLEEEQDDEEQDPNDEQDDEEQDQEQQEQDEQQNEQQQEPPPEDQQPPADDESSGQEQQESPLPQFRDLPDMSAEEAASILEAIENMERERRREEALEAARKNTRGKKDW